MNPDPEKGSVEAVPSRKIKVQVVDTSPDGSTLIAEVPQPASKVEPTAITRLKRLGQLLGTTTFWVITHPKWVLEWVLVILVVQVLWTKGVDGLKDFIKALVE